RHAVVAARGRSLPGHGGEPQQSEGERQRPFHRVISAGWATAKHEAARRARPVAVVALTPPRHRATVRCFFPTSSRTLDAVSLYRSHRWLTLAALALSGCGGPFPQSTLAPASGYAREIDGLFGTVFK